MKKLLAIILALLIIYKGLGAAQHLAPAPRPADWREQFSQDLLGAVGNYSPTREMVAEVVCWTMSEDSSDDARTNPLNTTMPSSEEVSVINSDGVRRYSSYEAGLAATVATIQLPYYRDVVQAMLDNDPAAMRQAIWASPWEAEHYHYGGNWAC